MSDHKRDDRLWRALVKHLDPELWDIQSVYDGLEVLRDEGFVIEPPRQPRTNPT